jgi:hypothetical protein
MSLDRKFASRVGSLCWERGEGNVDDGVQMMMHLSGFAMIREE